MDLKLLSKKIEDSGFKKKYIAQSLGISYQCFLNKMRGVTEFTVEEARKISGLLSISLDERSRIFF